MADIINFKTPNGASKSSIGIEKQEMINTIIKEITNNTNNIEEIMTFIKTKEGERVMYHSDCSLEDKSTFIQLLQCDIFNDINPDDEDLEDFDDDYQ